jgi:hypothetical protein
MSGTDGQVPERAYQLGDLVEDVQTGETWTVDDCGNSRHPAHVTLGRETREGALVTDRLASQIHLVTPWAERPVYPGDGWSDHVMLRQTGQTLTEFGAGLPDPPGDPAAWQSATAAQPEVAAEDVEPDI